MNAIAEKIATLIDPRITAYIAKFRYSTTSPSSAPQLRSCDSRILAYIAKYPLKPASEATTSLARPEPLFQPRRRPNLFVQPPAPNPHPVPEPPAPPSIPQPNSQEVPELFLPFYEGQVARIRSSGISGMVVYVGPNQTVFLEDQQRKIHHVEASDMDPAELLTTDAPIQAPQATKPAVPFPYVPFPIAPKHPLTDKPFLPKPSIEPQPHIRVSLHVGRERLQNALEIKQKIEALVGKGNTKDIHYEDGVLTIEVATDLSGDALRNLFAQEHIANVPIKVFTENPNS